jgi:FMN phosphatase YigB (HAD superfamily)
MLCQLFLDDSERNIAAGKALGLRTALVIIQPISFDLSP